MVTAGRQSERGMTLVEIMVTLVISSIVAASTFMFFAGQQRIYDTQTKLLNIQQNLWAAMEVMARYARAAGGGMYGCVRPASYANLTSQTGGQLPSPTPQSDGPTTRGGTTIKSLAQRPLTGVRAGAFTTSGNNCTSAHAMQWIPPLWIVDNDEDTTDTAAPLSVSPDTDVLTVAFGNRTSGTDVDAILGHDFTDPSARIQLKAAKAGNMFRGPTTERPGEFILLLAPDWGYGNPPLERGCTMFQITDDPLDDVLLYHDDSNPWNANVASMLPTTVSYTSDSAGVRNFGDLTWMTFFIQKVGANGTPSLMMQQRHQCGDLAKPQVLAEGIEDLQVSFACDTGTATGPNLNNPNGTLDEGTNDATRRTDEWWNNVPNDGLPAINTAGFCNLPTAVRITMVARTLSPDDLLDPTLSGNGPMDVEDHCYSTPCCRTSSCPPAGRPTDQYRRRVLTTTVYPRNNKPL
jgi:prepilin-type N-terminal cleavage/methylation domain-containing protein